MLRKLTSVVRQLTSLPAVVIDDSVIGNLAQLLRLSSLTFDGSATGALPSEPYAIALEELALDSPMGENQTIP
jgi:hypothetical protein